MEVAILKHNYKEPEVSIVAFNFTDNLLFPSSPESSEPETVPEWGGEIIEDLD